VERQADDDRPGNGRSTQSDGDDAAAFDPWWGRPRARLAVPFILLALVAGYAIATEAGSSSHGAGPTCKPGMLPTPVNVSPSELAKLVTTSHIGSLVGAGRPDVQGAQDAAAAVWADNPPAVRHAGGSSGSVPAGYEMRWWSRNGDHQVADVFAFPSSADAARFVERAAEGPCRRAVSQRTEARLPGEHVLLWRNPLGFLQADVYFSRGKSAYRVTDVPGQDTSQRSGVDRRRMVAIAQSLACRLVDAGCFTHTVKR
jgi:hypothetical protein